MAIEVVSCIHPGSVDLRSSNHSPGDEVLHCSATEWAEFMAAVKAGEYNHLSPRRSGEDKANRAG
jgi:Domain of unknown function (DUF397)